MAKFSKVSKKPKVSIHSRAARRAVSPPLHTVGAQPHPKPTFTSNAGISKRKKKVTQTRAQKLRAQKAVERASAVADQIDVKIQRSEGHAKVIKERSKQWVDVNIGGRRKGFEVLGDLEDEEVEEKEVEDLALEIPRRFGDGDVPLDPEEVLVLPLRTAGSVSSIMSTEEPSKVEPRPEDIPLPPHDDVPNI